MSARVHPSETASSYVLRYFIEDVIKKYSKSLLESCVIIIIPMLNPDGVAYGLTRHNLMGLNLNAYYKQANRKEMPTIWAFKKLVKYYHKENQ